VSIDKQLRQLKDAHELKNILISMGKKP